MLERLSKVALEVKYLDRAKRVYVDQLDLSMLSETATEVELEVGNEVLVLRRPEPVPRGGVHVHFAFSTPTAEYADWWNALEASYHLEEHVFGASKSLYFHDPDDHCVEIGQRPTSGSGLTGIFEVVLEVESLPLAERFYRALGFEPIDRGEGRRRVRLDGPVALELWEPQLGLADARGGVHMDLEFIGSRQIPEPVRERAQSITHLDDGIRIRCPDGHYLTIWE